MIIKDETVVIDINDRFREELRELQLAPVIVLEGNEMMRAIAERLLSIHASKIVIQTNSEIDDSSVERILLMSLEEFGTTFLRSFLEGTNLPGKKQKILLCSISESELIKYAKKHSMVLCDFEKNEVRDMLDAIVQKQPQTYFSLAKGAKRLLMLRK